MALKEQLKQYAYELGANLVGFGNIERCRNAPPMMSPQGLYPGARTVLVMAIHHPDATIELGGERHSQEIGPYSVQYLMNSRLDEMSYRMATYLERLGYGAVPIASSNIWRYNQYKELTAIFAPDVSHIYMAVVAGLSEIGYNGISLTPEYGARNRFVTVITDAQVEPDPLIPPGSICDKCLLCAKNCPTQAFDKEVKGDKVVRIEGYEYRFPNKNLWRCSWGEHFDLDLDLPIPEVVDEKVIMENVLEHGTRSGEMGQCLKFCVPPALRTWDRSYSRTPMRKNPASLDESIESRATLDRLLARAYANGAEGVVTFTAEELAARGIDVDRFLKGARAAVTVAIAEPARACRDAESAQHFRFGASYLADSICLDLAREIEELGFRSVMTVKRSASHPDPMTDENVTGSILAAFPELFRRPEAIVANTVITRKSIVRRVPNVAVGAGPRRAARERQRNDCGSTLTRELTEYARSLGADLVGVASASRLDSIAEQIRPHFEGQEIYVARDRSKRFTRWEPEIQIQKRRVKRPADYVEGAKSVLVFALRYHEEVLRRATLPPAEAVGPYAFQTYVTNWMGGVLGSRLVKRLEELGYAAAVTMDLLGTASFTGNPRGPQPDSFSNRFAAVAAGLATLSVNARAVSPEFGQRQRFVAVVTDAPLQASPLPAAVPLLCGRCSKMCIASCPSHAIGSKAIGFTCEGRTFSFHAIDNKLCDWTKRYALQGESGYRYNGSTVDIDPEGVVTPEKLARALPELDPIKKARPVVAEPCLIACPYANTAIDLGGKREAAAG